MLDLGEEIFQALVGVGEVIAQVLPKEVLIGLLVLLLVVILVVASALNGAQP